MRITRGLPWGILLGAGVVFAALWANELNGRLAGHGRDNQGASHGKETHYVSARQLAQSNAMVAQVIKEWPIIGNDDQPLNWKKFSGGLPVVLVFIKEGCPCSTEFEPFFHRVEKLYRGKVRFIGVIDAKREVAQRYAKKEAVPYRVLPDPDRQVIRRFKAENGGYVVLLSPEGVIEGFWPGCTAATMQELNHRIAGQLGIEKRFLDVAGMPVSLITGCPYES
jgi:peroxiredoxin